MFIRFLVLILFIASLSTARGQQQLDPFEVGVRIGVNSALLYNYDLSEAYQGRAGLSIGGLVKFRFSRWIAIQPELLYSQQGTIDDGQIDGPPPLSTPRVVRNNYLLIPVLLKFYPTRRFNLQVGPQLGVLLTSTINGENSRQEFTPADLSLAFGAGYEFNVGLLLTLRLSAGFTDVDRNNTISSLTAEPQQLGNGLLLLSVGWRF